MIFINEWLPNPAGNDAAGEFVELFNNGDGAVSVNGWTLETSAKKPKKISGTVPAGGYLLLERQQTKLVLKNSDEALALYNSSGELVGQSGFAGSAPQGKSFSHVSTYNSDAYAGAYIWADPTPGAMNRVATPAIAATGDFTWGVPLNKAHISSGDLAGILFAAAALLTALILYSIKVNEDLSDLFFSRDKALR